MDFTLSPEIESLRVRTRAFIDEHVLPLEADRGNFAEHENIPDARLNPVREKAKKAGLWAPQSPKEYGGMIKAGTLDAQENPLANTVTYGVHKFHRFHTLSYHFYISRPIFLHRASFEAWPEKIQRAMQTAVTEAVAYQRKLALEENQSSRKAIEAEGCEINELTSKEHDAFVAAVQPLLADARKTYGETMFRMVPKA